MMVKPIAPTRRPRLGLLIARKMLPYPCTIPAGVIGDGYSAPSADMPGTDGVGRVYVRRFVPRFGTV